MLPNWRLSTFISSRQRGGPESPLCVRILDHVKRPARQAVTAWPPPRESPANAMADGSSPLSKECAVDVQRVVGPGRERVLWGEPVVEPRPPGR